MNRIIRNLALAAAFFCCLGGLQAQVTTIDSGYCGGEGDGKNLTWTLTSDSVLTISGSGKMADYTVSSQNTPWQDYLWQIKTLIIGDSVTTIGTAAFYNCSSLTAVTIIGNSMMQRIKSAAFAHCSNLLSLTIYSPSPPFIEDVAFLGVPNTITIYVPCGFIPFYKEPMSLWRDFNNYIEVQNVIIQGKCGANGDNLTWQLSVCDSVLTISGSGKMEDYNLTITPPIRSPWYFYPQTIRKIIIGDSVTSIGNVAFYNCLVRSAIIGKNVTTIGNGSFLHCRELTSITIPNSVISIGVSAFESCESLTSITIPNNVTDIGSGAFSCCYMLSSVTIGSNVSNIGIGAFGKCYELSMIILPNKLIGIGDNTFYGCRNLAHVSIGDGLYFIRSNAFYDCISLDSVVVRVVNPPMLLPSGNNVFRNVPTTASVYVKCESMPAYKADTGWSYFSNFYAIDPPPTPTPTVTQQNNTMQITWTSTGAPDYEIYRNNVRLTKVSTTSYTDSNLTVGTTYCYQIKAIEENCESLLSDTVCRTFDIDDTGIKQLRITNYELRVYPNPANYELKITNYELKEGDVIEIYNVVGQKVGAYPCGRPETTINVQHLPNGMYFIKVNERVSKFVKMSF